MTDGDATKLTYRFNLLYFVAFRASLIMDIDNQFLTNLSIQIDVMIFQAPILIRKSFYICEYSFTILDVILRYPTTVHIRAFNFCLWLCLRFYLLI